MKVKWFYVNFNIKNIDTCTYKYKTVFTAERDSTHGQCLKNTEGVTSHKNHILFVR